ncbi:unnamed protein product [Anisakis simplex]|uniref:Bestrophin homolog n=1 Tax=Anisakis simplex TaxID=6269 RepID=A0A0M3JX87_ANISI|nr:unnamed protein product [Anisakis simplex]
MTISYQLDVTHASALSFFRLLFRWRASFWKDIFKELLVWCTMYFMIAFCYRSHFIMNDAQRIEAILIGNYVQGDDEQTKMMRRAMVRYMCLSQLLVYRDISVCVRKRFPTNQSIIQAGFMLEHEEAKLESISLEYDKYWVPINWSYTLFFEARRAKKIASDAMTNKLCDEMKNFRQNLQMLCNYDWVPIPLTYPQVIMVAVYFYFIVCLVSRQFISSDSGSATAGNFEMIVPLMTIIQFVFFVGWMKAAEVLLNPMGEDDDDFETNFLLDKNLAVKFSLIVSKLTMHYTSLNIVDASGDVPITEPDQFWLSGRVQPIYPLSVADEEMNALVGSAVHAKVPGAISTEKRVEMVVRRTTSVSTSQSRIASRRQRFSRQISSSSVRFDQ